MNDILTQLGDALVAADKAGDVTSARALAAEIQRLMRQGQPPAPPVPQETPEQQRLRGLPVSQSEMPRQAFEPGTGAGVTRAGFNLPYALGLTSRPGARSTPPMSERPEVMAAERERLTLERQIQLQKEKMQIGEAPSEARRRSGYGMTREEGYKYALGQDKYEVRTIESEGPYKGEIVFRAKGSQDPWTTVRNPDFMQDLTNLSARGRDVESVLPTLVPELAQMFAGGAYAGLRGAGRLAGGLIPGRMLGAGVAGGGARGAAEMERLAEGRKQNVVPPEDDIRSEAIKLAIIGGLTESAGVGLQAAFRALKTAGLPEVQGLTPEMWANGIRELAAKLGPEGAKLITAGDVFAHLGMDTQAALYKGIEQKIAKTAAAPQFEEFLRRSLEKERFAGGLARRELPEGVDPPAVDLADIGRQVERIAPGAEDVQAALRAVGGIPTVDRRNLAQTINAQIKAAEENARAPISAVYERINTAVGGAQVPATKLIGTLKNLEADFSTRLIEDISTDNVRLVLGALEKVTEKVAGSDVREPRPVTFKQLDDAIHDLRRVLRENYKGEWRGSLKQILEIENSVVADREALLRQAGREDLIPDLQNADKEWKAVSDTFRRSDFADAFRVKPTEIEGISAEKFMDKLVMDRDKLSAVLPYIAGPERQQLRALFVAQLSDLVPAYGKGRRDIAAAQVNKILQASDSPAPLLFSQSEIDRLGNAVQLRQTRKLLGVEDRQDFGSWFGEFYKKQNIQQASELFQRVDAVDPALGQTLRGLTRQKLFDDLSAEAAGGQGKVLDPKAFTEFINDQKRLQWAELSLGVGLQQRLRIVADATESLFPSAPRINIGERAVVAPTMLGEAKRVARAAFGPLSREQRLITYATEAANANVRDRIARAIMDPEYFGRLLSVAESTPSGRLRAATLGALLGEAGTDGVFDNDKPYWWVTMPQRTFEQGAKLIEGIKK